MIPTGLPRLRSLAGARSLRHAASSAVAPAPPASAPIHGACGRLRYNARYRSLIIRRPHHPVAARRLRALLVRTYLLPEHGAAVAPSQPRSLALASCFGTPGCSEYMIPRASPKECTAFIPVLLHLMEQTSCPCRGGASCKHTMPAGLNML